jgi:tetratricopeptide (TPR) repeat protein
LKNINNTNQAIQAFEVAYNLNNKNELVLKNIIKLYLGTDIEKANLWLDKLLSINPNHQIALRVKGDYYKQKSDIQNAIKYYNLSLLQSPNNSYLLKQLAILYIDNKQFNHAIEMLDVAFRITGKNTTTANYLARTLMIAQNNSEISMQRALRISRNIFKLRPTYTSKFTLTMALRLNNLEKEADSLLLELNQIPVDKPSQKKLKDALFSLKTKESLIDNLSSSWLW